MGKVVKAIAAVAIAVAIAVAAPALAPGLVAVLGSVGVTVTTAVATAIIGATLSLAAGALLSIVAGKPTTSGGGASPTTFRQSIVNARIIYGMRRAGGVITFFHPKKVGKTHYRYFVVAITGHRCAGASRFFLNDQVAPVDGNGKVISGPYAGAAWLWFDRGDADAVANPVFVAECDGKWTSAHRGRGVSKLYAKFEMTDAIVEAGFPNMTVEVMGKDDIRDPRTGARSYLRNAVAIFYDWMAMPREDGGFGAYADEIPDDDWLSAMCNVADEAVPLRAGGTEERYAFDSVIEVGAAPSEVRSTFVTCCAGSYTYSGGKHLMRPGYWVPISARMEEDDLAGPISIPLLSDEQDLANEVSGTFIDPTALYQPQPIPTRSIPSTDLRQGDYDLPHITSHPRGQRILEIMLRRSNAEKRVSWPMNIMGLGVAAMDTVQLGTARYGLSNYAWTVKSWGLAADFSVVLGLREENADIYHWSTAMELLPGEVPTIARADPIGTERAAYAIVRQSVAYPIDSTKDTISIQAFEATIDDGRVLNFPAQTITGLANSTVYIVLWDLTASAFVAFPSPALDQVASSRYVLVREMTTANADGTYPSTPTAPGGDGGGGYGGGYCVTVDTLILMEDGSWRRAGELRAGDRVRTQHEGTMCWGVWTVTSARIVRAEVMAAPGYPNATPEHRFWTEEEGWFRMERIGAPAGWDDVVKITVAGAHTYFARHPDAAEGVLSHNIKQIQQNDA